MDIEQPLFQPFPSDIVYQNFEPFQTYEVPLQLRNNDKVRSSCRVILEILEKIDQKLLTKLKKTLQVPFMTCCQ